MPRPESEKIPVTLVRFLTVSLALVARVAFVSCVAFVSHVAFVSCVVFVSRVVVVMSAVILDVVPFSGSHEVLAAAARGSSAPVLPVPLAALVLHSDRAVSLMQVTGFLGSGKTTLVNYILKSRPPTARVAVIENEVGEVNIDNSLVSENLIEKEDLVAMDKGCVCCSLRSDIVRALKTLYDNSEQKGFKYSAVVLETTGLADPAPVAFTFFSNHWIAHNFRLDAIICLVDAQHIQKHLQDASSGDLNEAVNQIAFADLVLLNKIDLVSRKELDDARDTIRSINITADVLEVSLAPPNEERKYKRMEANKQKPTGVHKHTPDKLTWGQIIGINSFSIERATAVDPTFYHGSESEEEESEDGKASKGEGQEDPGNTPRRQSSGVAPGPNDENDEALDSELVELLKHQRAVEINERQTFRPKKRTKKLHDLSGVGSVGIYARGPLDQYRFNCFFRDLLSEKSRDIYRSKGCLCIKGQENVKFVFQGVHETVCFGPVSEGWGKNEDRLSQIVFIGRNLDREALTEGFRSCIWVPLPEGWEEFMDPRLNRPYYVNKSKGLKQWDRPSTMATAWLKSTQSSHEQPVELRPKRSRGSSDGNPNSNSR